MAFIFVLIIPFMLWKYGNPEIKMIALAILFFTILIFILSTIFKKSLNDIANGLWSILKIGFFILIIIYVGIVFHWASEEDNGIMVQSFEISNLGANISGTSIADLLSSELQDIAQTNERMQKNDTDLASIRLYNIEIPSLHSKSVESSLSNIGSIGSGGSSLSLGQLSLSLKQLLHTQPLTIKGSIHKFGPMLCIVANMDGSNSSSLRIWKVNRSLTDLNKSPDEFIPYLIKDLAYQIALDVSRREDASEGELPHTWQAFQYVNEAQKDYIKYVDTDNISYLYSAENRASYVLDFEPDYQIVQSLYYIIGYEFLNRYEFLNKNCTDYLKQSELIFKRMEKMKSYSGTNALGLLYAKNRDYKNAADAFNRTIKLKPDSFVAWYNKGYSLYEQESYKKANLAYDMALSQNQTYAPAWWGKGMIFYKKNSYLEASDAFYNATIYDKKNKLAWYYRGKALYDLKKHDEQANACFNEAVNLEYFKAWNYIGIILNNSGKYGLAIKAYDYYLSNESLDNDKVWYNKGRAYYSWGRYEQAVDSFDEATWINPSYVNAWLERGNALYKMGWYNQSIQSYNRTIELDKNNKNALDGQKALLNIFNNTAAINTSMNSSNS